ncbi:amino acid ABC transporter ATP-binding/permease protein [Fenollaria sporofastidiosus]|uniref:amino acid ABC transporter ATP-binding/permease protein n=1 Tax=Fenollaria sporofastidiosus TaxID=2811778 RepID=UPI001BFFFB1D|nr:ABC transporter ATP-binding protein [Fenollaria sporofastidiosus]
MQSKRDGLKVISKLVKVVKPLSKYMAVAVLAGCISFLFYTAIGVLGARLIIEYVEGGSKAAFIMKIMAGAVILRGLFRYLEQYMNHLIAFRVLALLRNRVFAAIRRLAPAKIEMMNKGDLISAISSDMELLEVFYAHTISPVCIAIITSLVYALALGQISPLAAIVMLVGHIAIAVVLPMVFSSLAGDAAAETRRSLASISNSFLDLLRGIAEIISFAYQKRAVKKVNALNAKLKTNQDRLIRQLAVLLALEDMLEVFVTAAVFVVLAKSGNASSDILLASSLTYFSFGAVRAVSLLGNGLAQTLASADRVMSILEEKPMVEEITNKGYLSKNAIASYEADIIEVNGISFAYKSEKILDNFSLRVKNHEFIGIQGPSGCGKSTMLKLIMHFWNLEGGEIKIAGKNILDINTASLYEKLSYMTQTSEFFEGSIRDNLLIAKPDATDEELKEALRKASILDYVSSLKDGLDTYIKELGENFSGGEQQRLGLARCFLKDAEIYLFDEPTSNLDALNESIILNSIKKYMKGKTVLMVSHRDSTLRICDNVIILRQNRT